MKKLFALAIVAGMVFASCNSKPAEVDQIVEDEAIEATLDQEEVETPEIQEDVEAEVAE